MYHLDNASSKEFAEGFGVDAATSPTVCPIGTSCFLLQEPVAAIHAVFGLGWDFIRAAGPNLLRDDIFHRHMCSKLGDAVLFDG
jgi:hypothetical protein